LHEHDEPENGKKLHASLLQVKRFAPLPVFKVRSTLPLLHKIRQILKNCDIENGSESKNYKSISNKE
jgi:hypothetical protein